MALFEEKKRVQDLEERVAAFEKKEAEDGNEKIKSMFLNLKKKYAQALHALNDKEKKCHDFEKVASQLEAIKLDTQTAKKQLQMTDEECVSLRQQQVTLKKLLQEAQNQTAITQEELHETANQLQASDHMREAFETENQELKTLREEFEFIKIQAEASQLKANELAAKLDDNDEFKELQAQCEMLKKLAADLQAQAESAQQVKTELGDLQAKFETLLVEHQQQTKELHDLKTEKGEKDSRMRVAQHHLAKKVKETALLSEKIEDQKIQLHTINSAMEGYKTKINDMQSVLDSQMQQEKRIEENLLDSLKTSEIQARRWEEKYFQMCDKWQETESSNKELKSLEEKFHQMQALLGSFANILGDASPFTGKRISIHSPEQVKLGAMEF